MHKNSTILALALAAVATFPASAATVVEYIHTDALGSPVAVTDANQSVVERSEYEPYGRLANRPLADGPGYTGHVGDAITGLNYMQQRYYDAELGRFLSVDPVQAYSKPGSNFNRFWYANNNPYRFTDPDGRYVCVSGNPKNPCSVAQANQVERGMKDIRAAMNSHRPGSTAYRILDRALKTYGKAGEDNGIKVNVDSSLKSAGSAWTSTDRTQTIVSVNPDASKRVADGNAALERADFAGTLVHEMNHGIDQRRFGMATTMLNVKWGEKRAYTAEAVLFMGLGQDAPSGVWSAAGGIDPSAIEKSANRSTASWCKSGGGCP